MEKPTRLIRVCGASEGPLAGVDLELPLDQLLCFTGRNGSGSRAMAVDVLFAESRRQYLLALSPAERQGLGGIAKVQVERIEGLPPAVFFDGRENRHRGTLAAFLQVDYLFGQLLHQAGQVSCPKCGEECLSFDAEHAVSRVIEQLEGERCLLLAPLPLEGRQVAGVLRELTRAGFLRVRLDGRLYRLDRDRPRLEPLGESAWLEVVVDRLTPGPGASMRLLEGVRNARAISRGLSLLEGLDTGRQVWVNQQLTCSGCGTVFDDLRPDDWLDAGGQAHPLALQVRLAGCTLGEFYQVSVSQAGRLLATVVDDWGLAAAIGRALDELKRLNLGALPLGRRLNEVSSGERQCLLLAHCLNSGLVGVLYIFAGISLPPAQQRVWLEGARRLVDRGNTVLLLDHAPLLLAAADRGWHFCEGKVRLGCEAQGAAASPRVEKHGGYARLAGCGPANLKSFELSIPLGRLVCLTGDMGSGKSVLLQQVIIPWLGGKGAKRGLLEYHQHPGIRRVVQLDGQELREDRTLIDELGLFEPVSRLFAEAPAAVRQGYPADWFRLDRPGGRCPSCEGRGVLRFDMQFMEDISLRCPTCDGQRYRPEVLEITVRGLHVGQLLEMAISRAGEHFVRHPTLGPRLAAAQCCGLESRLLGEAIGSLEWGERLRLSLAREVPRAGERDLFVLDMPTAGEHPCDVARLTAGLRALVDRGASVLVAEHHPGFLEMADGIIDIASLAW